MGEVLIKNLTVKFDHLVGIYGLCVTITDGELVCVLGPSGCGKTTFLRVIAGFIKPNSGEVWEGGLKVENPGSDRGMVFQEYALFPWRSVRRNVEFGLEIKGLQRQERRQISQDYIDMVELKGYERA